MIKEKFSKLKIGLVQAKAGNETGANLEKTSKAFLLMGIVVWVGIV